jgi:type II secretory pathway component PulJ
MPRAETDATRGSPRRAGGILLELLLAIALFAAAAAFTMSALRSATDGVRRADLRARAADLAESRLAELDTGLVSAGELGEESRGEDESELAVSVEIVQSPTASLARARATVSDMTSADRTVVAVAERTVDLGDVRREEPAR